MRLAVLAGNRLFPLEFIKRAKAKENIEIVAIAFRGETNPLVERLADKTYWIEAADLEGLISILKKEKVKDCVMVGQITPRRIFRKGNWEEFIKKLTKDIDWRPHSIFGRIVEFLEREGFRFLDSTVFMQDCLAEEGMMNNVKLEKETEEDIQFGVKIASYFSELDIGQTIVVKKKAVVACEALEGTDNTIRRAYRLAGGNLVVVKFAKKDQDLRFDVPVVGLKTISVLKKRVKALVLEKKKVIILKKNKFLKETEKRGIAVIGKERMN